MKVGLIDVDGHRWPNLCLMKLSAYHRARGDTVEWHDGRKYYDLVYMSRVFTDTYSKDDTKTVHADKIIRGGTGYGLDNKLPDVVEHACPDYRLYPQFAGTAYGFLSRGCPRGCGATVDFTQGLDIRLATPDKVEALNRVKTKMLHFAWDNPEDDLAPYFKRFVECTSVKDNRKRRVYVLTNYGSTKEQDLYRIYTLRDLGFDPYVMIYEKPTAPQETRKLQRWVNNKRIFWSVRDFEAYDPKYGGGEKR